MARKKVVLFIVESVFHDSEVSGFSYKEEGIYANNRERIIRRNDKKAMLLNLLVTTNKVFGSVPYRVFYFSCNLEHVLHNERQVDDKLKIERAKKFQDRYIDDLGGFVDLMCTSDFAVKKEYKESWDFIKQADNSIKRFSNFNILLEDYLS